MGASFFFNRRAKIGNGSYAFSAKFYHYQETTDSRFRDLTSITT
jgi:hypothetical protein